MNLRDTIFDIHDNQVNQKYGDLPYSFHLKCVRMQGLPFMSLCSEDGFVLDAALYGHDLMEDARYTYNDVKTLMLQYGFSSKNSEAVAEIIYCVTDEKGRNRSERKNAKYYHELRNNESAVFVKLADIAANTLFSKLTGSSMYNKYKKEFPKFKELCYVKSLSSFFDYVENL